MNFLISLIVGYSAFARQNPLFHWGVWVAYFVCVVVNVSYLLDKPKMVNVWLFVPIMLMLYLLYKVSKYKETLG